MRTLNADAEGPRTCGAVRGMKTHHGGGGPLGRSRDLSAPGRGDAGWARPTPVSMLRWVTAQGHAGVHAQVGDRSGSRARARASRLPGSEQECSRHRLLKASVERRGGQESPAFALLLGPSCPPGLGPILKPFLDISCHFTSTH